jgi:hypothetical protein
MRPMLGKTKWWEKKAIENKADSKHYKTWCVIERITNMRHVQNKWEAEFDVEYVAVAWDNVPAVVDFTTNMFVKRPHIGNLTREEAVAMAKMLNFVGKVEE